MNNNFKVVSNFINSGQMNDQNTPIRDMLHFSKRARADSKMIETFMTVDA
jgi:hypothetical protein